MQRQTESSPNTSKTLQPRCLVATVTVDSSAVLAGQSGWGAKYDACVKVYVWVFACIHACSHWQEVCEGRWIVSSSSPEGQPARASIRFLQRWALASLPLCASLALSSPGKQEPTANHTRLLVIAQTVRFEEDTASATYIAYLYQWIYCCSCGLSVFLLLAHDDLFCMQNMMLIRSQQWL